MALGTISGQVRLNTRQAVAAYAKLRADNARTVYAMRGTGDAFIGTGKRIAFVGAGMVSVFGAAVKAAAEFERKMDYFGAVTDTSAKQMKTLSKYTLKVAQDTIYSADQIAEGFIELGKSGITAKQIMHGVGDAVANLGAAGDIPLTQSAQIITSTMQQFGLKAGKAAHIADTLAGAANASIADISDLGVSLKYVGGVADAAGLGFDDTATAISIMAKAGIRGSTAGTSLRQMIVSLPGVTLPAHRALEDLGIITGEGTKQTNKFYTAAGNLKPLSKVYEILRKATKNMTAEQRLSTFRTIFNNRALSAAAILTRDGAKGFKNMSKAMKNTTAAEVQHKRLDNLSGDIEILKGNIETLLVTQGSPFQKQLRKWTQNLTKMVQAFSKLNPKMQENIFKFLGIGGTALIALGTFTIFIGMLMKFLVAAKNFAAGLRFLVGILGLYSAAAEEGAVATGILAGPIGWVVLAIVALVAAFIIAYKHSEKFRTIVNKIGNSFVNDFAKPLWAWTKKAFAAVVTWLGKAIAWMKRFKDKVVNGFKSVVAWFGRVIQKVKDFGGKIKKGFTDGVDGVKHFVGSTIKFFKELPGKIFGFVTGMVSKVVSLFTFRNIGYALGFLLGTIIRIWWKIQSKILSIVSNIIVKVGKFFLGLPAKIGHALAAAYDWVTRLMTKIKDAMLHFAIIAVANTLSWFKKLPGRIRDFLVRAVVWVGEKLGAMVAKARELGPKVFWAIINWIKKLPGRIRDFLVKAITWIGVKEIQIFNKAKSLGRKFIEGAMTFIKNLPAKVREIIDRMIQAIKDKIGAVKQHMKDFAGGMWQGFKDGLGINSPSFVEKATWQMTGVVSDETKKLAGHTKRIQKLGKQMINTQFGVDDSGLNKMTTMGALVNNKRVAGQVATKAGARAVATQISHARHTSNTNNIEVHNPRPERASQSVTKVLKSRVEEAGYND